MDPVTGLLSIGSKLIDHFWPNKEEAGKRKIELALMAQNGDLKELEISMSAIVAEAKSKDKWTSRARPTFMYLFYVIVVSLVIIFPTIGIFFPEAMAAFYKNLDFGFKAIPEPMWWTFTTGYLGYTGARSYDKKKAATK